MISHSPNKQAKRHATSSSSMSTMESSSSCGEIDGIRKIVSENPVVVVGRRGCCMCHVAKRLLQGLGVNPAMCEVSADDDVYPLVFVGGQKVGGVDRLMAVHISGELVPILKHAGALWL